MKVNEEKRALVTALTEQFGTTVTRKQVVSYVNANGTRFPHWLFNNKKFRAGRGTYNLSLVTNETVTVTDTVENTVSA